MGIGLMAFLRQRGSNDIAKNEPAKEQTAPPAVNGDNGLSNKAAPSTNVPVAKQAPDSSGSPVDSLKAAEGYNEKKTRDAAVPLSVPESEVARAPAKDDRTAGAGAGLSTQPYALEPRPAAAAPPPPATKMGEMAKSADEDRAQVVSKREDQNNTANYEFKSTPNDEHGPSRAAQRNNSVYQPRQKAEGTLSRGQSGADKEKSAKEVESRTVAGRRFIREGDAWIDTAYDSSRATTRVTRGSDQFRALVADEPGIRTIADQLDGVVIVVWKSRAYRIQ